MNEPTLYRRNFLLHLQERPGFDESVLLKEPAWEQPSGSHLDQLHNEYAVTRRLAGVAGVRPALAKEGTESRPELLLEYIKGQSLAELIRSASLDLDEKLRLALNLSRALSHIHEHQVTHKDVSSGNILVAGSDAQGSQGGVYLIDFGLASTIGEELPSRLAADGTLVGTLAYVSPEQTGRMNRHVDHRTDLYSLGVVLYELFTGQLPFEGSDALQMIHAHIARQPKPPNQIDTGIPRPVSDIILKLLAKNAEDRYQSARGLQFDLERCLDQLQDKGRVERFALGSDDFTGRLQIPQKLYGRQAEIEQLRAVFDQAIEGSPQLLLVAGYSGVGKTSLVHEIERDVIAKQGIIVEGKFDQLQRSLPYSAWSQALTQLVNNWLTESETSLADWRETILEAVGESGQILIDIIPALERIIGRQPDVPELGGREAQNRFNYTFNRFINGLATPEHPLAVFLDDLQWVDSASLNLIESLLTVQSVSSFLIIGAYRNNEVAPDHPLMSSQERMRGENKQVTTITLRDLAPADTNQMLADTLRLPADACRELSQALVHKTAGNPFFLRQQLYALESEELLSFDHERRRWVWDDDLQQSLQAGGKVVDLMVGKIQTLPLETQNALSMAACIGARFRLTTLEAITGRSPEDSLSDLNPALRSGLVFKKNGYFSFAHDRIQEAGYALIPQSDLPRKHLKIGRSLLADTLIEALDEQIFAIVSHLNAGRGLIDTDSEGMDLIILNLKAGQKAKSISAFAEANTYIEIGLEQLGPDAWQTQYELTLSLYNESGELAYYTGQYDQIALVSDLIHRNAKRILDQVRIYMIEIEAATSRYDFGTAVYFGLDILKELDIDIPPEPSSEDYKNLRDKYFDLLEDRPKDIVRELPKMTDERALAASEILASELSPTAISRQKTYPIIGLLGANLTLELGLNVWSPVFFAAIGNVLWWTEDLSTPSDDTLGYLLFIRQMHEIALEMQQDPVYRRSRTRTLGHVCTTGALCLPIEFLIETASTTFLSGLETGDLNFGCQGAFHYSIYALAAGTNLEQYRNQVTEYYRLLHQFNQSTWATFLSIFLEGAMAFREPSTQPNRLIGSYFDEEAYLPSAIAANDISGRHFLYAVKLQLSYHFDVDNELLGYIDESKKFFGGAPGLFSVTITHCYSSLAMLRLYLDLVPERQKQALNQIDNCLQLFGIWSRSAPSTFQHMYDLIRAEKARVSGETDKALYHYEQAIQGAREVGFTNDEALSNELYARFWEERDNDRFAGPLMREAHSLYRKWGAHAKAEHLAKRYPQWLIGHRMVVNEPATRSISEAIPGGLDLHTVLKASRDIAGELALDSLLAKLMANVIESSGARQGSLILWEEGHWMIIAEASVDDPLSYTRADKRIDETDKLAKGIVNYVARTQQTVSLDDASDSGDFVQDPYVRAHRARSILCMPLVNQGKTAAVLYLENNLAPRVFSPERVSLLRLLSSQMAISIENARVHSDLAALLESRSKALASAETQVRTLFEESPLGVALSSYEGKILAANRAVLKMLRLSAEELLQSSVSDFYSQPNDRDTLLQKLEETGFVQDFGVQLVRGDGAPFFASLNMSKLVLEGNEVLLTMVEDVTAQITAEQESAILEERARLARELHDAVSQTLLSASLLAEATVRDSQEGRAIATEDLTSVSRMLRGALDEMRTLLLELRPAALRDRTLGQLLGALTETVRARSRAAVDLEIKGDHVLPEPVTMTLHRIAQESLTNAVKHAQARTIKVDLICDPDEVVLRVVDDGLGFDFERSPAGHHGLDIMRERAEEIGAVLQIVSRVGSGTQVTATWS